MISTQISCDFVTGVVLYLFFSFFTYTCTDCFSSVRSASIVPCRQRESIGYRRRECYRSSLSAHPRLGRRTIVDKILNTDTCRLHVSSSLCFYDSPFCRVLSFTHPLVRLYTSPFLSFSHFYTLSLSYSPTLVPFYPRSPTRATLAILAGRHFSVTPSVSLDSRISTEVLDWCVSRTVGTTSSCPAVRTHFVQASRRKTEIVWALY